MAKSIGDYKYKMLNGIVVFEIAVTDLESKRKLSQNRTETEKQNIIEGFLKSSNLNKRELGGLMKQSKQTQPNDYQLKREKTCLFTF